MGFSCEAVLWVKLLTAKPFGNKGDKEGRATDKSSPFQRGPRPRRAQIAGPEVMPPTPTLVAVRAPPTSWPRSSIPSSVHGKRGSPDRSRSGTTLTALNTCSFGNQVRTIVGRLFPADPCAEDCLQKVSTLMTRFSLALFELVQVWRWRAMATGANRNLIWCSFWYWRVACSGAPWRRIRPAARGAVLHLSLAAVAPCWPYGSRRRSSPRAPLSYNRRPARSPRGSRWPLKWRD